MSWIISTILVSALAILLGRRLREERAHAKLVSELMLFEVAENSPSSIVLEPCQQYGWLVEPEVQHSLRELEKLGFIQVGTFRVLDMPGLHIVGLIQSTQNFIACVYADARGITWVDVSAVSEDGEICTTSNSLNQEIIQASPYNQVRVDKSWSVVELFAQQSDFCEGKSLKSVQGYSFSDLFVQSYERDMAEMNKLGGVLSRDGFRRQQELAGVSVDEDALSQDYADYVYRSGVLRLHEECRKQFIKENQSAASAQIVEETLLAVHEQIPIEQLLPFVADHLQLSEKLERELASSLEADDSIREFFERVNEALPKEKQLLLLGQVCQPVDADIYALPLKD